MEVLNFETLNTFKVLQWMTNFIKQDNIWNTFPKSLFNAAGGIYFSIKMQL